MLYSLWLASAFTFFHEIQHAFAKRRWDIERLLMSKCHSFGCIECWSKLLRNNRRKMMTAVSVKESWREKLNSNKVQLGMKRSLRIYCLDREDSRRNIWLGKSRKVNLWFFNISMSFGFCVCSSTKSCGKENIFQCIAWECLSSFFRVSCLDGIKLIEFRCSTAIGNQYGQFLARSTHKSPLGYVMQFTCNWISRDMLRSGWCVDGEISLLFHSRNRNVFRVID